MLLPTVSTTDLIAENKVPKLAFMLLFCNTKVRFLKQNIVTVLCTVQMQLTWFLALAI